MTEQEPGADPDRIGVALSVASLALIGLGLVAGFVGGFLVAPPVGFLIGSAQAIGIGVWLDQ